MGNLGDEARQILDVLRDSIFRDVADQLDDEIAAGKVQFVRERKRKSDEAMSRAMFEVVPDEELARRGRKGNIDVRVTEYSAHDANVAAKQALHRLFIEPATLVDPLIKTLGVRGVDAIAFAEPDAIDQSVSLEDYLSVLSGVEARQLNDALKDGE